VRRAIRSAPPAASRSSRIRARSESSKIAFSSRGTPGRQTTGTPWRATSNPGASPAGLTSARAPAGTRTWRIMAGRAA
jgi:hypothetical protein